MTSRFVRTRAIGVAATVMCVGLGATSANAQVTRYVSDMQWTSQVNGWGPAERDQSNGELGASDGGTLTIQAATFVKGLGVHAPSNIGVQLGGTCTTFQAVIGVDDEAAGALGTVVFEIYGDGTRLYRSEVFRNTEDGESVTVSVAGFNELSLVVTDGGDGPAYDHADWANASVTCQGSPSSQFAPPVSLPALTNPHAVRMVDLNGDGRLDLVAVNAGSNAVSVWLGNGDATFGARMDFATGPEPKNLNVGDFNKDGRVDLVTANQGGAGTVSVLLANASGEFGYGAAVDYTAYTGAHDVAVGDFTQDGNLDLMVACWGGRAVLLAGGGSGAFSFRVNIAGNAPHSVVAADFTSDGRIDAAVANHDSASILFLTNTMGVAGVPFFTDQLPVGNGPHSIQAADLNGDGLLDLVVANDASNSVSVLLKQPSGRFFEDAVSYPTGLAPKGIGIGDINGDGLFDLLTANTAGNYPVCCNPGGDTISVLLNTGNGAFAAPQPYTVGLTPFGLWVGDLDGDGDSDVVTANWHSNDLTVLRNGGGGGQGGGYLSDLPWSSMVNGWGPAERDRSNGESGDGDGGTIRLDGITYAKGIGVHSDSRIVWQLNGQCTSFSAVIGVDDEVGAAGSVIFQVYADNQIRLHSDVMTGSTPARNVAIDVTGVNELSLVVHYGWDDFAFDHADWANAQVVCTP